MTDAKRLVRRALARVPWLLALARLTVATIRICLRYRVTGLASEAGFFALLSLPPLVLGLFGGVGYVGSWIGQDNVASVRTAIEEYAARFLTQGVIDSTLAPTVDDVLGGGRFDLISLGFVLSLWSGSRALNVFVDTISIMYGQSGVRGIVPTRALSFSLYVFALVVGIITIPLVLLGPTILGDILPKGWAWVGDLYWPFVTVVTVANLTTLYHVSTPRRSPWLRDVPGAVLTLVIWVIASFVVRGSIAASLGGTSIYGPLSAPIVLLIWLYALAIAILIGAALNAAIRELWPLEDERGLRERFADHVRGMFGRGVTGDPDDLDLGGRTPFGSDGDDLLDDDLGFSGLRAAAAAPLTPMAPGADGGVSTGARGTPRRDDEEGRF